MHPDSAQRRQVEADQGTMLLELARQLSLELHPGLRRAKRATLDAALDRDFGFDSLGRAELFLRVERAFGASLPEQLLASAETLRDLLAALQIPPRQTTGLARRVEHPLPEHPQAAPHTARTLLEVLDWHVQSHGERIHVHLDEGGTPVTLSYAALQRGAAQLAAGLAARGVQSGQTVALMLPTGFDYLQAFFGVLLVGAIPVPLYPPLRLSQVEEHLRRQARILSNAQARLLLSTPQARSLGPVLKSLVDGLHSVITVDELREGTGAAVVPNPRTTDIAFLQYTSGSTGDPKGVVLSHDNVLSNVRAMGQAIEVDAADVVVSWLPLYHDMGLIGAWLGSLYYGCPLVLMSPLRFLARPARWLWAIAEHRGTLSAAPNFAYELCTSKIDEQELASLDLSSWRMALNGAEPVSASTLRRFCARFAAYGFRREAMAPVYGLAESTVGLAFPLPGRAPRIDRVSRDVLTKMALAQPAAERDTLALEIVASGRPLPQHEIRIVDELGRELPDRHEGKLQFRGPSSTRGYFRNAAETARLFDGTWLSSGDLAYIAEGDVYVTGRSKDIIIRAGRHVHPQEIEDAVGAVAGVRRGCVAVFGVTDRSLQSERLIVLAETREHDPRAREQLRTRITAVATDVLGEPPDDVVLASARSVLKTSSGKIRRAACRQAYERDELQRGTHAVRWQLLRLAALAVASRAQRVGRMLRGAGYAGYAWLLSGLLFVPGWLLVMLLPQLSQRWVVARGVARCFLALSGIRLSVAGQRDPGAAVLVANHTSYLDVLVLMATFAQPIRFVAKRELERHWFTRIPLVRLHVFFVERADAVQSVADAHRARELMQRGTRFLFFPEGTLTRIPGLRPFHMGAFSAAAEAGAAIQPLAINGPRSLLRDGSWFLHRGCVALHFGPRLSPTGQDFAAALQLRDAARAFLLAHCGEPDLPA